jgi:hypothetical protein
LFFVFKLFLEFCQNSLYAHKFSMPKMNRVFIIFYMKFHVITVRRKKKLWKLNYFKDDLQVGIVILFHINI